MLKLAMNMLTVFYSHKKLVHRRSICRLSLVRMRKKKKLYVMYVLRFIFIWDEFVYRREFHTTDASVTAWYFGFCHFFL